MLTPRIRPFIYAILPLLLLPLLATPGSTVRGEEEKLPPDIATRRQGVDAPGFLGGTGTNSSPETGIRKDWSGDGLPVVWSQAIGVGYGGPSVARGRLFIFDRVGDEARLLCLEAETGKKLWDRRYPTDYEDLYGYNNGPRATPVVDGDRVYTFGAGGRLVCRSIRGEGRPIWEVDTSERFGVVQNFFGVGSTPVVEGDLLIVPVGGSPAGSGPHLTRDLEGNGSGIVAFDKLTGKVRYRVSDELASYASPVIATIEGRRRGFHFARGGLIGFDPATGKVDFHYPWRARILESVNASNPVVVGDRVFISETYGPGSSLIRVTSSGHEVVWRDPERSRQRAMQTHWNTAIHHEGHLYGSSGRHASNAELRCIALEDGAVRWSVPGLSRSSLLLVDDHLVGLTEYGGLFLFRATPEKYEPVSEKRLLDEQGRPLLRYPAWAAPLLSHGLLYLRASGQRAGESRLVCLELIPEPKSAPPESP